VTVSAASAVRQGAPKDSAGEQVSQLWSRWALVALLAGTALLYLWDLPGSAWANSFYSAAAEAGSQSWKAFLFGSSDAGNAITIDKPPLALWPMTLSVRAFGLSSWSILVPQALMGVASVATLWDIVRRRFGESAGLAAGLVLALTPIAVAMFRYNNPDALLVLLMIAAVWAVSRAVDDGRTRWLLLAGGCVGLAFLTKQLQALLILPALGVTYLVAGPPRLRTRLWQLLLALTAAVAAGGWWMLLVQLWPPADRPWIGGTNHNSVVELTFGYNGLGRLDGDEPGSTAGLALGPATGSRNAAALHLWGRPGIGRLFDLAQAGDIVWLLPTAALFGVALVWWRGRAPRTDARRAQVVIWALWLVCTAAVFSFMAGIFHPYYTVALAPAIAALAGTGAVVSWQHRRLLWGRVTLAVAVLVTAATAYFALSYYPLYHPRLKWLVVILAVGLCAVLLAADGAWSGPRSPLRWAIVGVIAVVALAGPAVYSLTTVSRGNAGGLPMAGPTLRDRGMRVVNNGRAAHVAGCSLLQAGAPPQAVVDKLDDRAAHYRWVAATVGSMCAAGYQLASGHSVLPVGGFNATDPAPSPDRFLRMVLGRQIHYFIVTNPVLQDRWGHLNDAALIQQWVQRNFTPTMVGRVELYDLTQ
jgi:4-amino-4-deoxy-L-arabinose transferase-like glycosyltransferase